MTFVYCKENYNYNRYPGGVGPMDRFIWSAKVSNTYFSVAVLT